MLTYEEIISWFQNRLTVIKDDKNNVAFTLQKKTSDGKYEILQGIFNTEANEYVDCRSIKPEGVDSRLVTIHATNELVVYT